MFAAPSLERGQPSFARHLPLTPSHVIFSSAGSLDFGAFLYIFATRFPLKLPCSAMSFTQHRGDSNSARCPCLPLRQATLRGARASAMVPPSLNIRRRAFLRTAPASGCRKTCFALFARRKQCHAWRAVQRGIVSCKPCHCYHYVSVLPLVATSSSPRGGQDRVRHVIALAVRIASTQWFRWFACLAFCLSLPRCRSVRMVGRAVVAAVCACRTARNAAGSYRSTYRCLALSMAYTIHCGAPRRLKDAATSRLPLPTTPAGSSLFRGT